jgi:hypothetical protein
VNNELIVMYVVGNGRGITSGIRAFAWRNGRKPGRTSENATAFECKIRKSHLLYRRRKVYYLSSVARQK